MFNGKYSKTLSTTIILPTKSRTTNNAATTISPIPTYLRKESLTFLNTNINPTAIPMARNRYIKCDKLNNLKIEHIFSILYFLY
jgi:hypothetical protein